MNEIIFEILNAVVGLAVILITRYLVPWIITKLNESKYSFIAVIVTDCVRAAEQMIMEHGAGTRKYEMVVRKVRAELAKYNIKITDSQLDILIESAVQTINESKMILEPCEVGEDESEE